MPATLDLSLDQVKLLINQFNSDEKMELTRYLEAETFELRFRRFLDRFKSVDLTMEEITREVEAVRQARYEQKVKHRH